jgi:hypothetical protein
MSTKQKENEFGDIPFFVFYSTVLSRLAYFTSEDFLPAYLDIFGPIIKTSLMEDINNAPIDKIFDPSIYKKTISSERIPVFDFEGQQHVDFKKMAEQINDVNIKFVKRRTIRLNSKPEVKGEVTEMKGGAGDYTVAYISISTSNYAGYYILVDTRMPNSIFVLFRGTYSTKSAGSYSKPSSIVPFNVAKQYTKAELEDLLKENQAQMFGVLTGINKILEDVYHSIIESMVYLSKTYLNASSPESVKVFTTGHSLGGALTTLFTADWKEFTELPQYNKAPYNIFSKKICCVSLAAPRVLSSGYSNYFCKQTIEGNILFRRVTNRGDPVPALPSKSFTGIMSEGFQHPCSAKKYAKTQREVISLDCGSAQSGKNPDYLKPLYCRKTKTGALSGNISGNILAHTAYLYINFFNAIDLKELGVSSLPSSFKSKTSELTRTKTGATNTRIILGTGKVVGDSTDLQFKSIFFTLNDLRPKPVTSTDPNATPIISSDLLMNQQVFEELIKNMTSMDVDNLNPLSSDNMFQPTVFKDKLMPNVTGIYLPKTIQAAGKRTKKSSRKMKRKSRRKYK